MNKIEDQTDMVVPAASLGRNFDQPALPVMSLATKARVWGDKAPSAVEPVAELLTKDLRSEVLRDGKNRCYFCGFPSMASEVHNLNHNHQDLRKENLRPVDALCHGWQHLGELGVGDAFISYLPGLSPQDVNHLQRSIFVALETGDEVTKEDARKLLNWMASHRQYTEHAWGTFEPSVFADALAKSDGVGTEVKNFVLQDLAVVFNPGRYSLNAQGWSQDAYKFMPAATWPKVYYEIMNAPS